MPRIDQTDPEEMERLGGDFLDESPLDVCQHCYTAWQLRSDVAHPSYAEVGPYYCGICGAELTAADD